MRWFTGDPYSVMLAKVAFSPVVTDLVAIGALNVALFVTIRACRFIYSVVRGGDWKHDDPEGFDPWE